MIVALQKDDPGEIREKEEEFLEVFRGATKNYFWSIGRSTGLTKSEIEGHVLFGVYNTLTTIRSRVRLGKDLEKITPGYVLWLIRLRSFGVIEKEKSIFFRRPKKPVRSRTEDTSGIGVDPDPLTEEDNEQTTGPEDRLIFQSIEEREDWAVPDSDAATPEEILIAKETLAEKQEQDPALERSFLQIFKEIWLHTDRRREFRDRRLVRSAIRLKMFDRWGLEFEEASSEKNDILNRRVLQWWFQQCGAMDQLRTDEEIKKIRNRYDQGKLRLEKDMVKHLRDLECP